VLLLGAALLLQVLLLLARSHVLSDLLKRWLLFARGCIGAAALLEAARTVALEGPLKVLVVAAARGLEARLALGRKLGLVARLVRKLGRALAAAVAVGLLAIRLRLKVPSHL
jgi:hypothetical protein